MALTCRLVLWRAVLLYRRSLSFSNSMNSYLTKSKMNYFHCLSSKSFCGIYCATLFPFFIFVLFCSVFIQNVKVKSRRIRNERIEQKVCTKKRWRILGRRWKPKGKRKKHESRENWTLNKNQNKHFELYVVVYSTHSSIKTRTYVINNIQQLHYDWIEDWRTKSLFGKMAHCRYGYNERKI